MTTVTDADKELFIAVLNPCDSVAAMVRKGMAFTWEVEQAAKHREAEVAKIVAWLDREKAEAVEMKNHQAAFWIVQMKKTIEAGEYRNDA